ncbi:MAG: peptidoglycan bridge formation glycyltransferase FemA/FemB family protein [Clostridia bacterium]|jgi:lipid II:glycine glycyltransferase (peptidoglycan interpeptide bridge formation enzyme)|nr:peptidoglycan bridge formation glycyltransferase FemA/FemB family protein [Clostridia bacterium]
MFTFKEEHDLAAFDAFLEAHGGQYIQCSRWQTVKTTWKCRYISGFDGDERVLAVLIMERLLPAAGKIWYGSGGPVCDYGNTALLEAFTAFIRAEVKANGVTAFIMDPPVSLRINGETQEQGVALHKTLTNLGYALNANIQNYTYKQPVQLFIPLKENGAPRTADQILKKCDKGVRYSIRLGTQRGLVAHSYTYQDIAENPKLMDDFISVMRDTGERDDFVNRNGDYCTKLLQAFDGCSDLKLVYYDKTFDRQLQAERLRKKADALAQLPGAHEKKARQLQEIIDSVDKQTEHFEKRMEEAEAYTGDNEICVAGGLSIYYAGMGSCLFGGTKNVIRNNTRSSHYLNYLRLQESIERGCDIHDLGYVFVETPELNDDGTLGALVPTDNFKGIYDFKKSFSADYHEFIGEYILVGNKLKYYAYAQLMPKAKKAKIKLIKKLR